MVRRALFSVLFASSVLASTAAAQTWDAPLFFSPKPMDEIGLYYIRSNDAFFGEDINGLKAIWRQSGNINLGVHAGVGDLDDIGNTILVGAELSNPIGLSSSGLALAWQVGAGAVFGGDYAQLAIPVGVSVGFDIGSGGSTSIIPYAHPRVSFDLVSVEIGDEEETESDFGFAVDLGVHVGLGSRFALKAAYTIGSENDFGKRDGFGIGAALLIPRKAVVR